MANVQYRGISGVIRRAINNGVIKGEIKIEDLRPLFPTKKSDAPDRIIENSLKYLTMTNEIVEREGKFFTKTDAPSSVGPHVSVIGEQLSMKIENGITIVTVKVMDLEYL